MYSVTDPCTELAAVQFWLTQVRLRLNGASLSHMLSEVRSLVRAHRIEFYSANRMADRSLLERERRAQAQQALQVLVPMERLLRIQIQQYAAGGTLHSPDKLPLHLLSFSSGHSKKLLTAPQSRKVHYAERFFRPTALQESTAKSLLNMFPEVFSGAPLAAIARIPSTAELRDREAKMPRVALQTAMIEKIIAAGILNESEQQLLKAMR